VTVWDSELMDGRVAIVIGAEGSGLSRLVAERVDQLVSIPMRGRLDSLNASTAAAVTLFEVVRRRAAP
jgi:23S rRNA (guanosine2251-2'-O)-methyltransferase